MLKTVDRLRPGEKGVVTGLGSTGAVRRHIIDMGITPGDRHAENSPDGGSN